MFHSGSILDEPQNHADSRSAESVVPVYPLPQIPGNQRTEKGTKVDTHVVNGETSITACATFRVELTDNCADVGLKQTCPANDEYES